MPLLTDLENHLRPFTPEGIAVAFSGGVDSALLLAVLARMRQQSDFPLQAWYACSDFQPESEKQQAAAMAAQLGVKLTILPFDPLALPSVQNNPPDRCYHCKYALFAALHHAAQAAGLPHLMDGSHYDDESAYRPGRRALREWGVHSPLAVLGIGKTTIRQWSAELGLSCAGKPAAPCLATRFPYGTRLEPALLRRVEAGENAIRQCLPDLSDFRLRCHGDLARIEAAPDALPLLLARRNELTGLLKSLGFAFVTLDLEGFRSGCFDPAENPVATR